MKLLQKTIAVTGAGSGIGQELCLELLKKGANVAAIDINDDSLEVTKELATPIIHLRREKSSEKQPETKIQTFICNIGDKSAVQGLPTQIQESKLPAIDGLINNAGILHEFDKVMDLKDDDIDRVVQTNLMGTIWMTRAFLPFLLQRPEAHLTNISSMGAFVPVPGQTIYGASKAAIKLFTEGLHSELADTNIGVTVVCPGAIETNIVSNSGVSLPGGGGGNSDDIKEYKQLPAKEAAKQILDAMETNQYRAIVGPDARVMDYLSRLSPSYAANLIQKQMKALLDK